LLPGFSFTLRMLADLTTAALFSHGMPLRPRQE
jgi:hypothetical protein